jgi:hypothetical protein
VDSSVEIGVKAPPKISGPRSGHPTRETTHRYPYHFNVLSAILFHERFCSWTPSCGAVVVAFPFFPKMSVAPTGRSSPSHLTLLYGIYSFPSLSMSTWNLSLRGWTDRTPLVARFPHIKPPDCGYPVLKPFYILPVHVETSRRCRLFGTMAKLGFPMLLPKFLSKRIRKQIPRARLFMHNSLLLHAFWKRTIFNSIASTLCNRA